MNRDYVFQFLQFLTDSVYSRIPKNPIPLFKSKIVAHRGAPFSPELENTMSAFRECQKMRMGGIELDIRWTRDDHPVVFHDASTHRLYHAEELISDLTFLQLRQRFPQIPHFKEVLEEFSGHFHFMIEIKTQLSLQQEEVLSKLLSHLKPSRDFHLLTLNPDFLSNLTLFNSETFILVSELNFKKDRDFVIQHKWGGYATHYLLLTTAQVHHLKSKGIQVGSGYTNSLNVMRREESRGLDWHFSNNPTELINNLSS